MSVRKKGLAEFVRWMGPLLDCLRALGGSAKPAEVSGWIARELKLPAAITNAALKCAANRFHNQVRRTRQYFVRVDQALFGDFRRQVA
ncbi:MAG TPA: hypothetical protein VGU65_09865 [Frateuria sp.]|uniref:hypothetical protein n=1 Tax=Frateuria sp. TaxID=2211372 RepID=UPI002DF619A7|nr:hypothetical protein [Frateuria sp.]